MQEPCIKGVVFAGAIDDINRLQKTGRVSEEVLDAHLRPQDSALLKRTIVSGEWYPIASYARFLQFLGEVEGRGKDAYFVERGVASARRMMKTGLYHQLDFLSRWRETVDLENSVPSVLIDNFAQTLSITISLTSIIYNVGKWAVERDPEHAGRVRIVVREAGAYSDPMRLAIEGFLNECARVVRDDPIRFCTSERPAQDVLLFRMTCDIGEIFSL